MSVSSPYPCQVTMKKFFVSGFLKGFSTNDKMGFVNWRDACKWARAVTSNSDCDFIILEMTDTATKKRLALSTNFTLEQRSASNV